MITVTVTYPNGTIVTRRLAATQAQMIINASRADGAIVTIVNNPTNYLVK